MIVVSAFVYVCFVCLLVRVVIVICWCWDVFISFFRNYLLEYLELLVLI